MQLLTDGHHQMIYSGRDEAVAFLGTLIAEQLRHLTIDPVVQHYLSLEYPYLPMSLQQIITVTLLEMGYDAKGPRRRQQFYSRPKSPAAIEDTAEETATGVLGRRALI